MTPSAVARVSREADFRQHFELTRTGLVVHGKPDIRTSEAFGKWLAVAEQSIQFAVGDFALWCEATYGEEAAQVLDHETFSEQTVKVYRWVAEKVPPENRMLDRLSFKHHMTVAALAVKDQKRWLDKAAGKAGEVAWPVSRLQQALKAGEDAPPTRFWVLVECRSEHDQEKFVKQQELDGRTCKAVTRRGGASGD